MQRLPPELITKIFCALPSLVDVVSLAATCRRLRDIWVQQLAFIYRQVAPGCIECQSDALQLLVDQGAIKSSTAPSSVTDVLQLIRNAHIVERSIDQFNREIVCKVQREKPPVRTHPICFTWSVGDSVEWFRFC